MLNEKDDCLSYLIHRAHRASEWRLLNAAKYPYDRRNANASTCLLELIEHAEIPDPVWDILAPFYDEASPHWLNAVTVTNRDVGFRKHPKDFATYLHGLVSNLTRH